MLDAESLSEFDWAQAWAPVPETDEVEATPLDSITLEEEALDAWADEQATRHGW